MYPPDKLPEACKPSSDPESRGPVPKDSAEGRWKDYVLEEKAEGRMVAFDKDTDKYTREQWNSHLNSGWRFEIKEAHNGLSGLIWFRTVYLPSYNKFVFETMN